MTTKRRKPETLCPETANKSPPKQTANPTHLVKHILEALLGQGRALDVLDRADFPGEPVAHLGGDGPLLLSGELLDVGGVVSAVW